MSLEFDLKDWANKIEAENQRLQNLLFQCAAENMQLKKALRDLHENVVDSLAEKDVEIENSINLFRGSYNEGRIEGFNLANKRMQAYLDRGNNPYELK